MSRFTAPLVVTPLKDGRTWVIVTAGFGYDVGEEGSGDTIEVPQGMRTDFASVPRAVWWFAAPWGKHGHAAVVHDAGYWMQIRSRREYDDIFLEGMGVLGVGRLRRRIMYLAVRWFGWITWNKQRRRSEADPDWKREDSAEDSALLEQLRSSANAMRSRSHTRSGARGETVLVTGGSGFLGSWCVVEALRRGYTVRTTVRAASREAAVRTVVAKEIEAGDRLSFIPADLLEDDGWAEAVEGCDYVLHTASPFLIEKPDDPDEFIMPAREGTLRVLRAALDAGVKRIVLTSSIASIMHGHADYSEPLTEELWTNPELEGLNPYGLSKTLAELAALELVRERDAEERLAVINPGAIIGPVLNDDLSPSVLIIERLLGARGIPRLGFNLVDVRDVAAMHLEAMTAPEAAGERFIATGPFQWMTETANILREHGGEVGSMVPRRKVPNFVFRLAALPSKRNRLLARQLGRRIDFSWEKAETRLGWTPRPVEETVVDTAESLVREGVVAGK